MCGGGEGGNGFFGVGRFSDGCRGGGKNGAEGVIRGRIGGNGDGKGAHGGAPALYSIHDSAHSNVLLYFGFSAKRSRDASLMFSVSLSSLTTRSDGESGLRQKVQK